MATFNMTRAREVLAPVYEDHLCARKLYVNVNREEHAPQRLFVPGRFKWGGRDHRVWLFFATMTDRREESIRVYESHGELAQHHPELYTREVVEMPVAEIESILMRHKVGSPRQSAEYWPRSARTLFEEFNGEPLAIYKDRTIDEIVAHKHRAKKDGGDRFPGFGPKILSLLSIYLSEVSALAPVPDAFPVDVHVQRFCISTGIIEGGGKLTNEEAERLIRPGLCALCKEMGWQALELSHAIWFLGNRLCTNCSRNSAAPLQCSAYEACGGAIVSGTYFKKGYWLLDETRLRKGGTMVLQNFEDMPLFAQCG